MIGSSHLSLVGIGRQTPPSDSKKDRSSAESNGLEENVRISMDPVSHRELDATLKMLDEKWSARQQIFEVQLNASIDSIGVKVDGATAAANLAAKAALEASAATATEGRSTRLAILGIIAASVIASAGLAIAAFESGRNVATQLGDAKQAIREDSRKQVDEGITSALKAFEERQRAPKSTPQPVVGSSQSR